MPVLKDMRCTACGQVNERMTDGGTVVERAYCRHCGAHAELVSLCNGGTKYRQRIMDTSPAWRRDRSGEGKEFEFLGVDVDDGQGNPIVERSGHVVGSENKFGKEAIRERRDRVHSRERRKRGEAPIFHEVNRG